MPRRLLGRIGRKGLVPPPVQPPLPPGEPPVGGTPPTDPPVSPTQQALIANERAKLTANALDRASTACVTVGVLGPIVATLYGVGTTAAGAHGILLAVGSVVWLSAAGALHWMARRALGRLR
jgi:hypothetical protein